MNVVPIKGRVISTRWQITGLVQTLGSQTACKVIAACLSDGRFLDPGGEPALLLLSGDCGPQFCELVRGVDNQLDAGRVLAELTQRTESDKR